MTYLGLRPGEKLYEELLVKTEELDKTPNSMIFIERDTPLCEHDIEVKLEELKAAWDMVHMSYDVACEPDPWQLMHLSQLISRERNPELREALEDLDEFMNGY